MLRYAAWCIYCPWVSATITHLTCAVSDLLPLLPDLSSYLDLLEIEMDATHHSIFMPGAGQHIVLAASLASLEQLVTRLDTHPATQARSAITITAKSFPQL